MDDERVVEALTYAKEETGLPLVVQVEINGGIQLYKVMIAINTERVAPKPLGYHDLTKELSANQAALFLRAFAVGYQYGNGKLRVGLKPPVYRKRRKKG